MVFVAQKPGYKDNTQIVTLKAETEDTITFDMQPVELAATPTTTAPSATVIQPVAPRNNSSSAPAQAKEMVRIVATPASAEIFVDGNSVGYGKAQVSLSLGSHTVRIRTPDCNKDTPIIVQANQRDAVVVKCGG
jgi:hypothetical protein